MDGGGAGEGGLIAAGSRCRRIFGEEKRIDQEREFAAARPELPHLELQSGTFRRRAQR